MGKSIYLIGSLRNKRVTEVAGFLREQGFDVFDDWMAAGPEADDYWMKYELERKHTYADALQGYAARHVYEFDKYHLDRCDLGVLILPAGKSGHLELGYMIGTGKPGFICLDEGVNPPPERFDVMYQFATGVASDLDDLDCMLELFK